MIFIMVLSLQNSRCIWLVDLNIAVAKLVLSAFGYISYGAMRRGSRLASCLAAMPAMPLSSFLPSFLPLSCPLTEWNESWQRLPVAFGHPLKRWMKSYRNPLFAAELSCASNSI